MADLINAVLALEPKAHFSNGFDGYSSIIWHSKDIEQPTEEQCNAKFAELQAAEPIRLLRIERNQKLIETDWMANKDVTLPAAWKTYRQKLRDLPNGLDTVEKVKAVTWPEKPE